MSSIFISFCFIKTVSGSSKCINGTALYRATNDTDDDFREFIFKGYIEGEESLFLEVEKESIALIVGRHVYEQKTEYVHIDLFFIFMMIIITLIFPNLFELL